MAMTFRQILAKTPRSRKDASASADIVALALKKTKGGFPFVKAKVKTLDTPVGVPKKPKDAHTYVSTIEIYGKGQVIVSCSCQDFMYTFEYALNKKGAARIEYCNGEPPGSRNPAEIPGCCKHLVALGEYLMRKGKL